LRITGARELSLLKEKDNKNYLGTHITQEDVMNKKFNRWAINYDNETDSLSFSEENLPMDTKIYYLDHELAVYLTSKNNIKGLFIEYFTKNFLSHNKPLNDLKTELLKQRKSTKSDIIRVKKTTAKPLVKELQEDLHEFLIANIRLV
jgi:hypothetical protein